MSHSPSPQIRYDATDANRLIEPAWQTAVRPLLDRARAELFADVPLLRAHLADSKQNPIPHEKKPLDSGFIDMPGTLIREFQASPATSLIGQIQAAAQEMRGQVDRLVVLGIGGSYMGARCLFEALCDRYHNERSREERQGAPRLYFEGDNLDNSAVVSLRDLLVGGGRNSRNAGDRWGLVVISKSGGTLETAVAYRVFLDALEKFYGAGSPEARNLVIPVTGDSGKLKELTRLKKNPVVFSIPEGVGGRFSVLTAVGLLPAAILGIDIAELVRGAADMTERFRTAEPGDNPVYDYTETCHLLETHLGLRTRILSTWGKRLEALGFWYDQLLAESLGKKERGALPLTVVNTRDLHSRGQQHQEGVRDKLITNVIIESTPEPHVTVPAWSSDLNVDDLNCIAGKPYDELLNAATQGTNKAYRDVNRPTASLLLPELNAYVLGQLLQMFMLATVLEGRLIGINPYGQDGVEDYKKNTRANLNMK
ncbi:MAG: glucose-6-phosphate isomerase [Planctomycetota bacterium]|nr:glucose-6-phosphate isomerase [Planctomycetota bacterium]